MNKMCVIHHKHNVHQSASRAWQAACMQHVRVACTTMSVCQKDVTVLLMDN